MRIRASLMAGICAAAIAFPAYAQDAAGGEAEASNEDLNVIIVTAQRQAQSLQEVPIAVSAFDAKALEAQQIENSSDLQLTLPNVSFTKSNFTNSSFTIRGIGDLCVGVSCDQATAIHVNSAPLFQTRLFETEFFDLERVEVLRGPQGTLFGRNATAGVVNLVSAKPDLSEFGAAGEAEYGNFNSIKAKGMINLPIGETLGVRLAGFYLNRDGYTKNLYDNSRIDDRDMYAIRGSIRWEPGPDTTVDLMGYYFREDDNRMRIQKQKCQRDPTGVLGCLNARRDNAKTNANSTFPALLSSREFLTLNGIPAALGLGSIYGADIFANSVEPTDPRKVNTAYKPTYFTDEMQIQGNIEHNFGSFKLDVSGLYQKAKVDSREDYYLGVGDRSGYATALNTLQVLATAGVPMSVLDPNAPPGTFIPGSAAFFAPMAAALIPQGLNGPLCVSGVTTGNQGLYEGNAVCSDSPLNYDRSYQKNDSWSAEAILSSDFDGPLNFLVGGIYAQSNVTENSYYVNSFAVDYVAGLLGSFTSLVSNLDADPNNNLPPSYRATSFYRNNTMDFTLKSYGIFGEAYYDISDRLKLTAGIRYNNDKKSVVARTTLLSFLNPYSNDGDPFDSPYVGAYDADPGTAGNQLQQERHVKFDEFTGRAVLDFQITRDNLLYASYSRGYKSGGINPPLSPIFTVPESFGPEQIDAFEIGSKNSLGDGAIQLNATAFYYKYKDLQLSRIVARTAVNDTIDANIWGVELESIVRPEYNWLINLNFSYLNTEVSGDQFFVNSRDPGAGDPDAVIIKDLTNGAHCTVTGPAPGVADAYVNTVNAGLGLQGTTEFPADGGIASSGAFSVCSALAANVPTGSGIVVLNPGIPTNLKGNKLPLAPNMKASAGIQYTAEFGNGMSLVPRFDLTFTGEQYGNVFNGEVNKIDSFVQANAQIQLNGAEDRWFVRGFVQNLFNSNAETGLYLTDASTGLFSNIFTLDPRRYGIAVGAKF